MPVFRIKLVSTNLLFSGDLSLIPNKKIIKTKISYQMKTKNTPATVT